MSFKGFLKTAISLLGGIFVGFGILILFLGLLGLNVTKNIENLDDTLRQGLNDYRIQNPEEFSKAFLQTMEASGQDTSQISKQKVIIMCQNPSLLDPDTKEFINDELCQNIESMSEEKVISTVINNMFEAKKDELSLDTIGNNTSSLKEVLNQVNTLLKGFMFVFLGAGFLYLLGFFLILVSVSFNWFRSSYRLTLKTLIDLLIIGGFFVFIHYIKPATILKLTNSIINKIQPTDIQNVPPILLKVMTGIILNWIRLSTDPLILIAFITAIPFFIATLILLGIRLRDKKEMIGKKEKTIPDKEIA